MKPTVVSPTKRVIGWILAIVLIVLCWVIKTNPEINDWLIIPVLIALWPIAFNFDLLGDRTEKAEKNGNRTP